MHAGIPMIVPIKGIIPQLIFIPRLSNMTLLDAVNPILWVYGSGQLPTHNVSSW